MGTVRETTDERQGAPGSCSLIALYRRFQTAILNTRTVCRGKTLKWEEVRERYPHRWLLVEAIQARSGADRRVVEALAVVDPFADSVSALRRYNAVHRKE